MANRTDSRRLDELVKQTLSNYEPASAVSDWSKMESMLGAVPKTAVPAFKFPSFSVSGEGAGILKGIFSSYIFIAVLMLAGGGYLLYTILKAPKPDNVVVTEQPAADTISSKPMVQPAVVSTTAPPAVTEIKTEAPKDTVAVIKTEPEKVKTEEVKTAEKKEEKEIRENKENKDKKDSELTEKKEKKSEKSEAEKLKEKKREEAKKAEKKEKERIAKEEKQKKETSKETLKKSNNPVGFNFLRSVNLDSLKKQQSQEQPAPEQQTKDSLKTP